MILTHIAIRGLARFVLWDNIRTPRFPLGVFSGNLKRRHARGFLSADISAAIRGTGVTEYWIETAASFRLDVSGPDHLAPLLGFLGDELGEVGGRADKRCASEVGEPGLEFGIGEAGVNCLVELVN